MKTRYESDGKYVFIYNKWLSFFLRYSLKHLKDIFSFFLLSRHSCAVFFSFFFSCRISVPDVFSLHACLLYWFKLLRVKKSTRQTNGNINNKETSLILSVAHKQYCITFFGMNLQKAAITYKNEVVSQTLKFTPTYFFALISNQTKPKDAENPI